MCQLTFVHADHPNIARTALGLLLHTNSFKHRDGWGVWDGEKVVKSALTACQDPMCLETCNKLNSPIVFGHVRWATTGEKIKEHAQPFDLSNVVVAHNGTVVTKAPLPVGKSDSQFFAERLNDKLNNPDLTLPTALKELYDNYYQGKFAFLLYDKRKDTYYFARGLVAPLHCVNITYTGAIEGSMFIVNTEKETLELALNTFYLLELALGVSFTIGKVDLIVQHAIYQYIPERKDIVRLKSMVEVIPAKPDVAKLPTGTVENTELKSVFDLGVLFGKLGLTWDEISVFTTHVLNSPPDDIKSVPDIKVLQKMQARLTDEKSNLWEDIKFYFEYVYPDVFKSETIIKIYQEYSINFPYFYASTTKLKRVRDELKKLYDAFLEERKNDVHPEA